MNETGIVFHGISKSFHGVDALSDVSLSIQKGSIHAIVGENGAGKSTLMNLLGGLHTPTAGNITIDGKQVQIGSPNDAAAYGIGMVHQHFMLIDVLKVWQNISLGIEQLHGGRILDEKSIRKSIQDVCDQYNFSFDLDELVGNLPVGEQQRIEILKVLYRRADYIILDEPTAVLTQEEVENLFESIRQFREMGKTILFISHKIEEVLRLSDRITVLRKGKLIGTLEREEATADKLVDMMVGREVDLTGEPLAARQGEEVLSVEHVCTRKEGFGCNLKDVSFCVRSGEVIGFAGVDGNGQQELVQSLLRLCRLTGGTIRFCGQDLTGSGVKKARKLGISCIPPDRHAQGLVLQSPVYRNMVLGFEDKKIFRRFGLLSPKRVMKETLRLTEAHDVRCGSVGQNISGLSGGNQQKVILARECGLAAPKLVVAANPTRGLDVGAIQYVYENLEALKAEGVAIVLISTELSEILRLSDRIAVLYNGQIMGILENQKIDLTQLGRMMMGCAESEGSDYAAEKLE